MPGPPRELLRSPENRRCADCGAPEPRWASVNLGVLICEVCSGIHRRMGTHISQVRSATLDDWRPEWVATLESVGNARAKALYGGVAPDECVGVGLVGDRIDGEAARALERWIRLKYEARCAPREEALAPEEDGEAELPLLSWAAWPRQGPSAEATEWAPSPSSPSTAGAWPVLRQDADAYRLAPCVWPGDGGAPDNSDAWPPRQSVPQAPAMLPVPPPQPAHDAAPPVRRACVPVVGDAGAEACVPCLPCAQRRATKYEHLVEH